MADIAGLRSLPPRPPASFSTNPWFSWAQASCSGIRPLPPEQTDSVNVWFAHSSHWWPPGAQMRRGHISRRKSGEPTELLIQTVLINIQQLPPVEPSFTLNSCLVVARRLILQSHIEGHRNWVALLIEHPVGKVACSKVVSSRNMSATVESTSSLLMVFFYTVIIQNSKPDYFRNM